MAKTQRPKQLYPMVEVWWDDASGFRHGWMDKSEDLQPQMVLSVGFLINESPDHVIIAGDTDPLGAHNGRTQIPRGMIKNMKILRQPTGYKKEKELPVEPIS